MGLTKIPVLHARWFSHCCLIAEFKGWECLFVQLSTKYIEKIKFLKMGNKKIRKRYFFLVLRNHAEFCRILHLFRRILQIIWAKITKFCGFLQNSAEIRTMVFVPQNCSAELQNVIIFCRSLQNWANLFRGILRACLVPQNSSAELCIINPFCGILQNRSMMFCRILWNSAD